MDPTPLSLLARLRQPAAVEAWPRFVRLYSPLLFSWGRRLGLQDADAADLVQDVFLVLAVKLPEFRYDPQYGFRRWLRTVFLNRWRDWGKQLPVPVPAGNLDHLADADPADETEQRDYRRYLVGRALRIMQLDFQPATWKACWGVVVGGRPAAEVAAELGLSVAGVYAAKHRVLGRLRQELAGLFE
jgi:RNA polymerase sigma-70 factor (ECF subfamily)